MNNKMNVALALAAGLAGGIFTRYIAPQPAFAQAQAPVTNEIRAQNFTLVDSSDHVLGTFAGASFPASDGRISVIVLKDPSGRVMWSAGGSPIRQLSQK
jgi:hypothetical protein